MTDAIIVVGAGPVGLTVALELARRDVPVRIVDRLEAPTTESRAILVHSRSLEMLDRIGLVDEVIASGVRTDAMELHANGGKLARIELGVVDSPYPYSVTTAQTETERILTAALATHGVTVDRGVTLTALTQDDSGVRATVRHADGHEEELTGSWLVGADGGHSEVRHQIGAALAGSFKGERFLMGDVNATHDLDPHTMYTFFSPHDGPLLVFPMRGDRVRLIAQVATTADGPATVEWLQRVVDERSDQPIAIRDTRWLTTFDIHHAQVPQYRAGRVFLAGDAAHIHSPAGGQGMNTGIQDAFNLGWKLALAATGEAGPALLDSYHAERHPVGAKVIEFTTQLTRVGTVANPIVQKLRNTVAHAATALAPVQQAMADKVEETALAYRGSPVVIPAPGRAQLTGGDHLPDAGPALRAALAREDGHVLLTVAAPGGPLPTAAKSGARQILLSLAPEATAPGFDASVPDPDGHAAARFGLPRGGRVMVRPDGYVALVTSLDDEAPLRAYEELLHG
ncbi:2-polyprenyl-6-methoxyphenol hydroxylase-like FAD-dependent oxidoreductase [Streptacidiphilus sp. MAP12-33]|uniref:FAD-dependent monooxygenase n=1 Tax=Streptacidiphilus sp. MAP12-33 TaxID=3156266 RepID=UPI0035184C31